MQNEYIYYVIIWQKECFIKRKDYTGQRFGHLVVSEMLYGYGSAGEAFCKCTCDCGNDCIKSPSTLKRCGARSNCGCLKKYYRNKQAEAARKNLVGKRFGNLVVTDMIYEHKKPTRVKCVCDCGTEVERVATYLTSGETTSCGCVQKERASKANTKDFAGIVSDYGIELISRHKKNTRNVWLWNCKCFCGNTFVALPARVLNGHITSCGCAKQSSRERLIERCLKELCIPYEKEYIFPDCRDKYPLRFDFYFPGFGLAIEYQGEQHYMPAIAFGGEIQFSKQQRHDEIKRDFCRKNNIELLELPYTLSDIEIREKLQTLFIRRDCNG